MSVFSIALSRARFCQNCEQITEMDGEPDCPVCGASSWMPLSTWLNRKDDVKQVMEIYHNILPTAETIRCLLHISEGKL